MDAHKLPAPSGAAGRPPSGRRTRCPAAGRAIRSAVIMGRCPPCCEDDASGLAAGCGAFDNATAENALGVLGGAIKNHGRPASIMADHGVQFYANGKGDRKRGESGFEERPVGLGMRQTLAGVWHTQTDGKTERLHDEMQRRLHEFGAVAMRKSEPTGLFMQWYNCRGRTLLSDGETPAGAFEGKTAPKGEGSWVGRRVGSTARRGGGGGNGFLDAATAPPAYSLLHNSAQPVTRAMARPCRLMFLHS